MRVRFPEVDSAKLLRTWAEASKILPEITRFFWGDIDLRWFPEACLSHPRYKGFFTVQHFIEGQTMPSSGVLDIVEWRQRLLAGQPMNGITPLEVAGALAKSAAATLRSVEELRQTPGMAKELRLTLGDLEAMAHLGNYYAAKIRGAAELALFDRTSKPEHRENAIGQFFAALDHWKRYAAAYTAQYKPAQLYNRVGYVDIPGLTGKVEQDIAIARLWTPGTIPDAARTRQADNPFRK